MAPPDHPERKKSALSLSGGVDQPGPVNPEAINRLKKSRKSFSVKELLQGIKDRDITLLSRAITLIESAHPGHQDDAQELVASCLPLSGRSFRLGITGIPGAGKSTFIEALGKYVIGKGGRLAVLAIDPSSERSRGSILGDKTRMEELAGMAEAYIRPSPAGGTLGGVARKTRETIILCEAAGFDTIFVETVGVGQSETTVHGMVDFFLLIMLAGAGDELQGIKRGIMEMADGIVINKTDGNNIDRSLRAQAEFTNVLHLFPPPPSGRTPQVKCCSSLDGTGIEEVWQMIGQYRQQVTESGYLNTRRLEQSRYWLYETIREGIFQQVFHHQDMQQLLEQYEEEIARGRITSFSAAARILQKFRER